MTGLMGFSLALQDCQTEADALGAARRQSRRLLRQATRVAEQDDQRRQTILTRTVELDVIPRLLIAHPPAVVPADAGLLVTGAHGRGSESALFGLHEARSNGRPVRVGLRLAGWILCGRRPASPRQARWG